MGNRVFGDGFVEFEQGSRNRFYLVRLGSEHVEEITMTSDEVGMQLHDQATRGWDAEPREQSQLEKWYTLQDTQESYLLQSVNSIPDILQIRTAIDMALAQLTATTQRIQKITEENSTLRHEILKFYN